MNNTLVTINVGGEVFTTTTAILRRLPGTLFSNLIDYYLGNESDCQDGDLGETSSPANQNDAFSSSSTSQCCCCLSRTTPLFQVPFYANTDSPLYKMGISKNSQESTSTPPPSSCKMWSDRYKYIHFLSPINPPQSCPSPSDSSGRNTSSSHSSPSSDDDNGRRTRFTTVTSPTGTNVKTNNNNHKRSEDHRQNQCHGHGQCQGSFSIQHSSLTPPTIFVDRNPAIVPYILDAYRLGELHLPHHVCSLMIRKELAFYAIPEDMISVCCWKSFHEGLKQVRIVNTIHKSLYDPYDEKGNRDDLSPLGKIWLTMERPSLNWGAKAWCVLYYAAITASILIFIVSSLENMLMVHESLEDKMNQLLKANESFSTVQFLAFFKEIEPLTICNSVSRIFFTIEFLIRLLATPRKRDFIRNGHNITDISILIISWLKFLVDNTLYNDPDTFGHFESYISLIFSCVLAVQVLRVCHLVKHMASLKLMYLSAKESAAELILLVVVVGVAVLLFGTSLFLVEIVSDDNQSMDVKNVPIAMWWAIITMTTVGYGDVVPKSPAGYCVGVLCALTGLLLVAMPIAIIARNFSDYHESMTSREQFVRQERFLKSKTTSDKKADQQKSVDNHHSLDNHNANGNPVYDNHGLDEYEESFRKDPDIRVFSDSPITCSTGWSAADDVSIISTNGISPRSIRREAMEMRNKGTANVKSFSYNHYQRNQNHHQHHKQLNRFQRQRTTPSPDNNKTQDCWA